MAYIIGITRRAQPDFQKAADWLANRRSPSAAVRWRNGILKAVRSLVANPDRCRLADEAADLSMELRELLYGRRRSVYRILFTIDGSIVHIVRVRHAAQDRLTIDDV